MSEIEQAIENLEYFIGGDCCDNQMDFLEEIGMGIAAFREKAERSKVCEYCDDNFKFWQTQISGELPNVRYCPMCGKRLEVEHD